ncbi:hypothetical protein VNI00_013009 [Paramarasmius palmivorus]|uniref:Uncharacterized protein n=1 Tax=Paramarasmius palmivorus TaxID=297713 RepID=A0AAW0BZR2_9AGAR
MLSYLSLIVLLTSSPTPSSPLSEQRLASLIAISSPCHQEFLNRVIDAYPRAPDGLLETLCNGGEGLRLLELAILRKLADYLINMERKIPQLSFITPRTRANVRLIINTMKKLIPGHDVLFDAMDCPSSQPFQEVQHVVDLSDVPLHQLWATEFIRIHSSFSHFRHPVSMRYDRYEANWLQTRLPQFLGIDALSGQGLIDAANDLYTTVRSRYIEAQGVEH